MFIFVERSRLLLVIVVQKLEDVKREEAMETVRKKEGGMRNVLQVFTKITLAHGSNSKDFSYCKEEREKEREREREK